MTADIYSYDAYRPYLQAWFKDAKDNDPAYSYRRFSEEVGSRDPALLHNVLRGRRNLSSAKIATLARPEKAPLHLRQSEARYLRWLWEAEHAPTEELRRRAGASARAARAAEAARQHKGNGVPRSWLEIALQELSRCRGFESSPQRAAAAFLPRVHPDDTRRGLDHLERNGLIGPREAEPPPDLEQRDRLAYQRGIAERAGHALALAAAAPSTREAARFHALTRAIPRSAVPLLQRRMDEMFFELSELTREHGEDPDVVYQINLQLFPLADPAK